ncbi:hypothetical protein [Pseudofrankia sp. DC12]|uniref:hypothetical protein n=1 Tax=Pseudofrankia sp. DC12 TaxID=683315 RepID=UPI000A3DE145|nr:hypothetical protein [Pseudofrankia sp. DC12]
MGMLDDFIDQLFENRKLFLLHMRNHGSLERIAHSHDDENLDIEERFRALLSDARVPRVPRLRLSFAFGAVAPGMAMSSEMFEDVPIDELRTELRAAVQDVLGPMAVPGVPGSAGTPATS